MNLIRTKSVTYALCAFVAAGLLAACSSGGTQPASPSSGFGMNSSASHVQIPLGLRDPAKYWIGRGFTRPYFHPDHHKTWISPDVQNAPRLLFGADSTNGDVYILRMPNMTLKGIITGFKNPQGECSDSSGNIYVADEYAQTVSKYSREGVLISVYDDSPAGFPSSCAVNPTNGELAVANVFGTGHGGQGNVAIFTNPSSSPTILLSPDAFYQNFVGYDPNGDLWADGLSSSQAVIVSFCGASGCSTIPITGGTLGGAGNVQWDRVRNTWVVFDSLCNGAQTACSYPVSIASSVGVLGDPTFYLSEKGQLACDLPQGLVAADHGNRYVAGGDAESPCGRSPDTFNRWTYPRGGEPTNHTIIEINNPSGAAISNKNK